MCFYSVRSHLFGEYMSAHLSCLRNVNQKIITKLYFKIKLDHF